MTETRQLNLAELPLDIIEKITEDANLARKMVLRKVCKNFREFYDAPMVFDKVCINVMKESIIITIVVEENEALSKKNTTYAQRRASLEARETKIVYSEHYLGCAVKREGRDGHRTFAGGNHVKMAVDDLAGLLQHPNSLVKLCQFYLDPSPGNYCEKVQTNVKNMFKRLQVAFTHKLNIRGLVVDHCNQNDVVEFLLPLSKPGLLEKIELVNERMKADVVARTEHWSRAKEVLVKNGSGLESADLVHFREFAVFNYPLDMRMVHAIIQGIHRKGPDFKSYYIEHSQLYGHSRIELIEGLQRLAWTNDEETSTTYTQKCLIPGTECHLSINYEKMGMKFYRAEDIENIGSDF